MAKTKDIQGNTFHYLTVIDRNGSDKEGKTMWLCLCKCGNSKNVRGKHLRAGVIKSCGCYNKEKTAKRFKKHGLCNHPLYGVWKNMKDRCYNPNNKKFHNYGGRGIDVSDYWLDFANFYNDVVDGYEPGLELDRINNECGYGPGNYRWVTHKQNTRNKSNNLFITYEGKTKTLTEWAEATGLKTHTLRARIINYGWGFKRALNTPARERRDAK